MRAGYHLVLETRPFVNLHDELPKGNVEVIWWTPPDMFRDCADFSRRAWRPVNMTAKWLEEELIPAAWAWMHRDRRTALEKLRGVKHEVPELDVRNWWRTVRAPLFCEQRPETRESLEVLLTHLQQHYAVREGQYSGHLVEALDVALLRMLESADLEHWGYVGSKGDLSGESLADLVASLRTRMNGQYEAVGAMGLEWRMRTSGEICRLSKGHINRSDIEAVAKAIRPLALEADRHNERLAHRRQRANVFPK